MFRLCTGPRYNAGARTPRLNNNSSWTDAGKDKHGLGVWAESLAGAESALYKHVLRRWHRAQTSNHQARDKKMATLIAALANSRRGTAFCRSPQSADTWLSGRQRIKDRQSTWLAVPRPPPSQAAQPPFHQAKLDGEGERGGGLTHSLVAPSTGRMALR